METAWNMVLSLSISQAVKKKLQKNLPKSSEFATRD